VVSGDTLQQPEDLPYSEYSAYLSRIERADERTRTAHLLQLRVRGPWLLGVARAWESRIDDGFCVPYHAPIAEYCIRVRVKLGSGCSGCNERTVSKNRSYEARMFRRRL
jgi:hypothetical protein